MVAERKICVNTEQIQAAHNVNAQLEYSGERYAPRHPVPNPIFKTVPFHFRNNTIIDWFIDPIGGEKDIIVYLHHRGETRFSYDITLETKLTNLFAALE